MKRLTREEDRALEALVSMVARILGPSWMRKAKRNPAPERITIQPGADARIMLDLNLFLVRALNTLSPKAVQSGRLPILKRDTAIYLAKIVRSMSRRIKESVVGPKPISRLIITGQEAKLYFGISEWAHTRWSVIRKNYIETATDVKRAGDHATRMLWIVRSILNVGHPPVEKSRFLR